MSTLQPGEPAPMQSASFSPLQKPARSPVRQLIQLLSGSVATILVVIIGLIWSVPGIGLFVKKNGRLDFKDLCLKQGIVG